MAAALAVGSLRAQVIDEARFTPYGDACGPQIAGSDSILRSGHHLTFQVTGATPGAAVALVVGTRRVDLPLPGTACRLRALPTIILSGRAGLDGSAAFTFAAPGWLEGRVFTQALSADRSLQASPGLEVLFPGTSPTPDPTTLTSYPCYYIQNFNWNYGGDGVGVVTGKIRWPSETCNSADGPPPNRPVLVFTHGNGMTHNDHDYLMAHLARNGFVTVSVSNGAYLSGSNEGRAREAISYLNSLYAFWGWSSRLSNKVVFSGHSRGGEAAVTAARLLDEQPSLMHVPYDVRAVIALAPTDGGPSNNLPRENLRGSMARSFLAIYGSHDPDVRGIRLEDPLTGPETTVFAIYDRAGSELSSEGLLDPNLHLTKSMVYVHGASHLGFTDGGPALPGYVTVAEHQDIAKGYYNAFLRWRVFGETAYRAYFDDRSVPTSIRVTDTELLTQLSDLPRRVLDNFEQGGADTNTLGGTVSWSTGIVQLAEDELWRLDRASPNDTRGMRIKWRDTPTPYVRWLVPDIGINNVGPARNVSNYRFLSLRVAQNYNDAWNTSGQDRDFRVRLYTGNGWSSSVRISEHGRIPYPERFVTVPWNGPAGDYSKSALDTIRLPLDAFTGADLTDVRWVYFYFDVPGSEFGSINLDSLEFAN